MFIFFYFFWMVKPALGQFDKGTLLLFLTAELNRIVKRASLCLHLGEDNGHLIQEYMVSHCICILLCLIL